MTIVQDMGDGDRFFSVNIPLKINGKLYRPSICYKMTPELIRDVETLAKEKRINIHAEKVQYVSGAVSGIVREVRVHAPTVQAGPVPAEGIEIKKNKTEKPAKEFDEVPDIIQQEVVKVEGKKDK